MTTDMNRTLNLILSTFPLLAGWATTVRADSVAEPSMDPSPAAELASFSIHPEFEVSLFADETMGIANPIAMHWDSRGRLWVLTTLTYAQLEPGEIADDKLTILEDSDGDGRADKSTVFADGLDMPMGFALGHGGVFLGEGPDLLFLKDSDGDDRADTREVVLTGFGTGDTHQNISNFTWGPDGHLYFSQGLHCYSLVETPWGVVRGEAAGFWRFDPLQLKLEPFCFPSLASQNPCGIAFDRTGAIFVKSNNRELIYATPGLISTTHQKNLEPVATIGVTPGKSMGGEYVSSAHLPDWLQDNIIIAGYYAHEVCAFPLVKEGAGYAKVEPVELMRAGHSSFRPVEIRIGPDGAIYIADWFNPIIGHYQASLRHPDRDEEHGRIWRMTAKDRKLNNRDEWERPETLPVASAPGRSEVESMIRSDDPRQRLDGIIAAAALNEAGSFPLGLEALDAPRDRFIDYSLEQFVHALAHVWIPATLAGELNFVRPEHLAYALNTLGGEEALEIARRRLKLPDLTEDTRRQLTNVVARSGSAEDLRGLLNVEAPDLSVLQAMAEAFPIRKIAPAEPYLDQLGNLLRSEDEAIKIAAIRLAGLWSAERFESEVLSLLTNDSTSTSVRVEASLTYAKLARGEGIEVLSRLIPESEGEFRKALVEGLVSIAPTKAAQKVAPILASISAAGEAGPLLAPFLGRKGAPDLLAEALGKVPPTPEAAAHLASAMSTLGRSDEKLLGVLHDAMGLSAGQRAYSPDFVAALASEVKEHGDAAAGKEIYHRAQLTCVACHQLGGVGGVIGPPLDAVGAGLSTDLLIESVLWPARQLKEGYFAVALTTKGGASFSGYLEKEADGVLHLRDTASGVVQTIPRVEVLKLDNIGTLMPEGLTGGLTREELRDLVAYLSGLRG